MVISMPFYPTSENLNEPGAGSQWYPIEDYLNFGATLVASKRMELMTRS